jgi:hypothetical protein
VQHRAENEGDEHVTGSRQHVDNHWEVLKTELVNAERQIVLADLELSQLDERLQVQADRK